jgi:iron complex outermembrane recepter protein
VACTKIFRAEDRVNKAKQVSRAPTVLLTVLAGWLAGAAPPAVAQVSGAAAPYAIEEIIVAAQKREQMVQHVPVAVTAMTGEMLRESALLTIPDLTTLNPSVSFDTAQSFQRSSLKIRGIGTLGNSRTFEGAVGVFVDGVYRARSGMVLMDLLDVDGLEVLRGPQSTLFGKNTVAGAISLSSARPDGRDSTAEVRIGDHGLRYLVGSINVPVAEAHALRFAGSVHERDAFFQSPDNGHGYDDVDQYAFKGQYLWTPREDLQVWLIADHAQSDAHCCWGSAQVVAGPTAPLIQAYSNLRGLTYVVPPTGERARSASLNTQPGEKVEDTGVMARVDWELGTIDATSITSIRDWRHEQVDADADFVAADLLVLNEPADIDSFSQELTFLIPFGDNRSDVLLGFYYGAEEYSSLQSVEAGGDADNYLNALVSAAQGAVACVPGIVALDCLFPVGIGALLPDGVFTRSHYQQDSTSLAAFAHSSIELSDRLALTAGLRYSIEDKDGGVQNLFWHDAPIVRAVLAGLGLPDDGTPRNGFDLIGTRYSPSFSVGLRSEETTGLISLSYQLTADVLIYGGYHRGFKAGGVNLFREGVVSNNTVYAPESADSVEIGMKAQYWNDRATTNVALFDTEFSDLQINFFTGLEFHTRNTGEAMTRGVEVESRFLLSDNLWLDAAVTYLDARFGNLDDPFLTYLDGRDTPRAPRWAANIGLDYRRPIAGDRSLFVRVGAAYRDSHYVDADVATESKADSYVVADASVGLTGRHRWEALLWCSNCGNKDYRTVYFNSTFQPGSYSSYLNAPRQYGVTFRISW